MSNSPGGDSAEDFNAIQTQWPLINEAHRGSQTSIGPARNALVLRYRKAIRNYLGALLKNDAAADELAQDAIVRMSDWMADWRGTVLQTAWDSLKEFEYAHTGNLSYTLFKLRSESPQLRSEGLAAQVSEATGRKVTAATVRQSLRRARFLFAQYLVEEVARCLDNPAPDAVEEELAELGLIRYVKDFMPADWRTNGMLRDQDRRDG